MEHHVAFGAQWPAVGLEGFVVGPLGLSRCRIKRNDPPTNIPVVRGVHVDERSYIGEPTFVLHGERLVVHADVVGRRIEQLGARIVGDRLHVLGAHRGGADLFDVDIGPGHLGRIDDRPARLHVDFFRPVHAWIELARLEKLPVAAIDEIGEAVAIEMRERRNGLATDLTVGEHHFIDAVVVPRVVRRHLIRPRRHASIRVTGEDGHGPLVVAWSLVWVP